MLIVPFIFLLIPEFKTTGDSFSGKKRKSNFLKLIWFTSKFKLKKKFLINDISPSIFELKCYFLKKDSKILNSFAPVKFKTKILSNNLIFDFPLISFKVLDGSNKIFTVALIWGSLKSNFFSPPIKFLNFILSLFFENILSILIEWTLLANFSFKFKFSNKTLFFCSSKKIIYNFLKLFCSYQV